MMFLADTADSPVVGLSGPVKYIDNLPPDPGPRPASPSGVVAEVVKGVYPSEFPVLPNGNISPVLSKDALTDSDLSDYSGPGWIEDDVDDKERKNNGVFSVVTFGICRRDEGSRGEAASPYRRRKPRDQAQSLLHLTAPLTSDDEPPFAKRRETCPDLVAVESPVVRFGQHRKSSDPQVPNAESAAGQPLLDRNNVASQPLDDAATDSPAPVHRKFLVDLDPSKLDDFLDDVPAAPVREWSVCHFSTLPRWLQDNDYLIDGHRPPLPSAKACVLSIFRIHTETGNIWSHLVGSLAFATSGAFFLYHQNFAIHEKIVFAAFFFCVFLCFFTSTMYHTMHCHSEHMGKFFSRLDYCGIVSIVAGCFTPWIHFLFWCEQRTKLFYLTLGYALCIVTINLTMWEKFGRPHYRLLRASVFTGLALSCCLIPSAHFIAFYGLYTAFVDLAFGWLMSMALVALFGVALYALRVPERFFPGKCDILFHSHQFFHLAVIIGAFIHLRCLCLMALYRHTTGNVCPA